jgi:hypothetical protein
MGVKEMDWKLVSYLSNGLLREGVTAIGLETLVLLRREVIHEYPKIVELGLLYGPSRKRK